MLKYLPEQGEIEMIKGFTGKPSTLANTDRYFLQLSSVPQYKLRIEAAIARATFEEEMSGLVPQVHNVQKACKGAATLCIKFLINLTVCVLCVCVCV